MNHFTVWIIYSSNIYINSRKIKECKLIWSRVHIHISFRLGLRRTSKVINTWIFLVTVERALAQSHKIKASRWADDKHLQSPRAIGMNYGRTNVRIARASSLSRLVPDIPGCQSRFRSRVPIVLVENTKGVTSSQSCTVNCITIDAYDKGRKRREAASSRYDSLFKPYSPLDHWNDDRL